MPLQGTSILCFITEAINNTCVAAMQMFEVAVTRKVLKWYLITENWCFKNMYVLCLQKIRIFMSGGDN